MNSAPDQTISRPQARAADDLAAGNPSARLRASVVNRTHRVVRERAKHLEQRRSRARSLWIPLAVCSALLVMISTAVWNVLDQYDLSPTGIPDASSQMLVFALWFLPCSAALLAMVWFRRTLSNSGRELGR